MAKIDIRKLKKDFKEWYKDHPLQEEASILCDVFVSSLETIPEDTVFLWLMSNWNDLSELMKGRV